MLNAYRNNCIHDNGLASILGSWTFCVPFDSLSDHVSSRILLWSRPAFRRNSCTIRFFSALQLYLAWCCTSYERPWQLPVLCILGTYHSRYTYFRYCPTGQYWSSRARLKVTCTKSLSTCLKGNYHHIWDVLRKRPGLGISSKVLNLVTFGQCRSNTWPL